MNGRVYDPTLGRFLSPDPAIQSPYVTNNFNRYSYVINNPLKYTDPTGFYYHEGGGQSWAKDFDPKAKGSNDKSNNGSDKRGVADSSAESPNPASVKLEDNLSDSQASKFSEAEKAYILAGLTYNGAPSNVVEQVADSLNIRADTMVRVGEVVTVMAAAGGVLSRGRVPPTKVPKYDSASSDVPNNAGKGLGSPFKDKSAKEIDQMFKDKGFRESGPDPLNGKGGYVNPQTGRSYHIDPKDYGKYREPSHVDVNRPRDYTGGLDKKKLPFKE